MAAQPATGHINPLLAMAGGLKKRGHRVVFAVPRARKLKLAWSDYQVIDLAMAWSAAGMVVLPFTSGVLETSLAAQLFFSGVQHYTRALGQVLDEVRPDVVVTDFAFPGAGLAAELRGIPHSIVWSAGLPFVGPGVPPPGTGLPIGENWGGKGVCLRALSYCSGALLLARLAWARWRLGLPSRRVVELVTCSCLTLVLTAEACEVPRTQVPDCAFFVGPCLRPPGNQTFALDPDRPKIYVSLGTVFNNRPKVFRKILDAFRDGSVQLIVSAGAAFSRLGPVPAHVLLHQSLDQMALLPQVDAVISHGGNNTVNETLAAGKPLLVLPVGGEQGDNASRVVHLGAGLRAHLTHSTSAEIRQKTLSLLHEPGFRERARQISTALARTDGVGTSVRLLEQLAATRQPMTRPPGSPLTIEG